MDAQPVLIDGNLHDLSDACTVRRLLPASGYGCAWIGHFVYENNRPATSRHPLYGLLGDWVM